MKKARPLLRTPMPYPKPFQVGIATQIQLARWTWLLPEPQTPAEEQMREAIKERFKGWTPAIYNAVDWTNRVTNAG